MANGLSKLIKRARKANENDILAKLARNRFRVEELEDRIAPAGTSVTCGAGANVLAIWDADNGGEAQFTDGDGFLFIETDEANDNIAFDVSVNGTALSTTANGASSAQAIDITVSSLSGGDNEIDTGSTITIMTNAWVDDIDLSALTIADGGTVTIKIITGVNNADIADATPDTFAGGAAATVNIGAGNIDAIVEATAYATTSGVNDVVAANVTDIATLNVGAGVGDIILPTIASGETATVNLLVASGSADGAIASATGDIGAISDSSSTAGTLTLVPTLYADDVTSISTGVIGTTTIGGSDGNIGSITATGAIGNLTIEGSVTGNISGTSIGNLTLGTNGQTDTVSGNITASTGNIGTINEAAAGATVNISGNITATAGQIGVIGGTAPVETLSGTITAGTAVSAITTVGAINTIVGQTVGNITTTNSNVTSITASGGAGTVGNVSIGTGDLGAITASGTTGTIGNITVDDITGNITATDTDTSGVDNVIGAINASGDISGNISGYTIGILDSDKTISGNVTIAGDSAAAIGAASITGSITIGGDQTGDIITDGASGVIADLNVTGAIDGNITASGGAAVIDAATITATGNITIQAEDDLTITLTGGIDASGGDTVALTADSDSDDGGDLVLTVGGQVDSGSNDTVNLTGENITFSTTSETQTYVYDFAAITADDSVTIGTLDGDLIATTIQATDGSIGNITVGGLINIGTLTAPDTDADDTGSIGNLTAGESITISTALTADQTIGNLTATTDLTLTGITTTAPAGLGTLTAGTTGALDFGTITVTAGGVGAITAGTTIDGAAITVTAGDLGAITAGDDVAVTGDVLVSAGNIGNITTTGSIDIDGDWTATAGSIGTISAGDATNDSETINIAAGKSITAGTTIGVISATGDIDSNGTATIVAGAQTVSSGVILSVTDNDVVYAIESNNADAADTFAVTYTVTNGADNKAAIVATRTSTNDLNISLTTSDTDATVNSAEFDLAASGLSVASGSKAFGVITVEGDTAGAVDLGAGSSATAILVLDQIGGTISVDSLDILAGANVTTAANADALTASSTTPGADPNATAAAGTFTLPLANAAVNEIVSAKADGKFSVDNTSNLQMIAVTGDSTLVGSVTFTAGALTDVTGGGVTISEDITADTDLSSISGAIGITGDITGAVTLGDSVSSLTITGDVSGSITVGDMTSTLTITGAVSSTATITAGDVAGTVSIGSGSTVEGTIIVGDISGAGNDFILGDATAATVTVGDVPDDVTIDSVDVDSTITIGDVTDDVTINTDMLGTLNIGDMVAGALVVTGNFGSVISIDGDVASITLNDLEGDGIIGSATSTITVTGKIVGNLNVNDDGGPADAITELTVLADITVGDGHLTMVNGGGDGDTIAYTGAISLGATGDAGNGTTGNITIDGTAFVAVAALDAAVFATASYDATNGQAITVSTVVLYDADAGAGAETLAITSDSVGSIIAGGTVDVAITVSGDITGTVIVDDDADISALGLTATGAVADSFDSGVTAATTGAAFAIAADSIGGVTVEGDMSFATIAAGDGNVGPIVAGGDIAGTTISATDGNVGNITGTGTLASDITVTDGNLGLIYVSGAIAGDIAVDEGYAFTGIINTNGGYAGAFNVEGTVSQIVMTGAFGDTNVPAFDTDTIAMYSVGSQFAIEGYTSTGATEITVVGATTVVTLAGGVMTVDNAVAGSTVTVDETEGNVATSVVVNGDLAGDITITGDLADPGSVNSLVVLDGDLSGTFTAQDDMTTLTIQGDWTGSVILANSSMYNNVAPNVTNITVWGATSAATLTGATFTTAVDFNGDAIDDTVDEVASKTVYQVPNSDQYIYLTGGSVTADISTLFGQVTGFELEGKGGVKIVTIESATTPDDSDMLKAAKYGKKMIKGNEVANDFIDFDAPGDANLPAIVVGPAVQINSLVVDGDVGAITDVDSNIKNVFVSGTAGNIFAGKNLINGYFGNAGDIKAVKVSDLHVEANAGDIVGEKLKDIDIEGNVATLASDVITNATVGGTVGDLMAAKINKTYTAGTIANLHIQRDFKGRPGKISNSVLYDITLHNIDFNATVGSGGASDVIVDNPDYNPVKIVNSFVEL